MRVSIIIPSCRFDFIQETFRSIESQTVKAHEVLFAYDTGAIPSVSDKINKLASIATGDAIVVLCDDDMLAPTFIEETTRAMVENRADVVYTDMVRFGNIKDIQPASEWNEVSFKVSTVPFITSLVKKKAFDAVGGWDPGQDYADYDFYYRIFKKGLKGYHLDLPLFLYRIHQASGSFNMDHNSARAKMKAKHPEIL